MEPNLAPSIIKIVVIPAIHDNPYHTMALARSSPARPTRAIAFCGFQIVVRLIRKAVKTHKNERT